MKLYSVFCPPSNQFAFGVRRPHSSRGRGTTTRQVLAFRGRRPLAVGATGVCFGCPYVYGLAIAVESGVCEVLDNLVAEFDLPMGLAGCRTIVEINKACLRQSN